MMMMLSRTIWALAAGEACEGHQAALPCLLGNEGSLRSHGVNDLISALATCHEEDYERKMQRSSSFDLGATAVDPEAQKTCNGQRLWKNDKRRGEVRSSTGKITARIFLYPASSNLNSVMRIGLAARWSLLNRTQNNSAADTRACCESTSQSQSHVRLHLQLQQPPKQSRCSSRPGVQGCRASQPHDCRGAGEDAGVDASESSQGVSFLAGASGRPASGTSPQGKRLRCGRENCPPKFQPSMPTSYLHLTTDPNSYRPPRPGAAFLSGSALCERICLRLPILDGSTDRGHLSGSCTRPLSPRRGCLSRILAGYGLGCPQCLYRTSSRLWRYGF